MNLTSQLKMFAMTCLIASTLAACTSDGSSTNASSSSTTVTGQAIAGAVDGNLVVKNTSGNQIATATVTNGSFSVSLDNTALTQTLDFEVTGTYRDEVSGNTVSLTAANPLALCTAPNHFTAGQTANAPVTPDTTIIREMVQNQAMTLTQAQTAFKNVFGYNPDLTAKPFDPYATTTIDSAATANNTAAFRVGMFSQLGTDLGLSASDLAELPAKFAADLADGSFDGMASGNPVTFGGGVNLQTTHQNQPLANRISISLSKFAGSDANVAGVTPPNMGRPPIVSDMSGKTKTIALADGSLVNVKVEAINAPPFQTGFKNVKTRHKITLTDASNQPIDINAINANVDSISFKPWMYMFAGHQHGTPFGAITETGAGTGVFLVDAYYMMPTSMMMGNEVVPMGQWSLDIKLGDTTTGVNVADPYAHGMFFPNVMMNMGTDLLLSKGSNASDQWTQMGATSPVNREYRVWLQEAVLNVNNTDHDLTIYVSTVGMQMGVGMIMPPVTGALCDASTDGGITWQALTATATNGQYKITRLTGLTSTTVTPIDIRLTVNGNVMTTAAGANLKLSFTAP
ncbi:MAG: hypothetical protein R8M46_05190 [Ghiorsea sp.]